MHEEQPGFNGPEPSRGQRIDWTEVYRMVIEDNAVLKQHMETCARNQGWIMTMLIGLVGGMASLIVMLIHNGGHL